MASWHGGRRTAKPAVRLIGWLLLLACAAASLAASRPEAPAASGITLTPARGELDLPSRQHTFQVVLSNSTDVDQLLDVSVAALGHALDGTPVFTPVDDGRFVLDVDGVIRLPAGASRPVTVTADFADRVAIYRAVVATLVTDEGRAAVDVETRLAGVYLLRGPRPWDQRVDGRGAGISVGADRDVASLHVDLHNVGDAHVRPEGQFVVSVDGTELGRVDLQAQNIIPGYARRLTGTWNPPAGLPDQVDLTVILEDGTVVAEDTVTVTETTAPAPADGSRASADGPGAFFGGAGTGDGITALHWIAVGLLLLAVTLLLLFVRRRRDHEPATSASDHRTR